MNRAKETARVRGAADPVGSPPLGVGRAIEGRGGSSLSNCSAAPLRGIARAIVVLAFLTPASLGQEFGGQHVIGRTPGWLFGLFPGDLDGDGDVDALASDILTDKIVWYENVGAGKGDGGGVFRAEQLISIAADGPISVYTADLDGDGDLDVLSASITDNRIAWFENLGGGVFGALQVISTAANGPQSVIAEDLDGDGDADVLSASDVDDKIAWYENLGGGVFGFQQVISLNASAANTVFTADLDGDGDADVLSASGGDDKIAWYENRGGGSFGPEQVISRGAEFAISVHAADLDGDGDADVLSASNGDNKIAWYENLGGGVFGPQQVISSTVVGAWSVYAADLDRDGDMDVLSASTLDDKVRWFENLGGGTFAEHVISTAADGPLAVYAADLNGNGVLDVISASVTDGKVAWYPNMMRDCNGNGDWDFIDIANGISSDCNANAIPDECDVTNRPMSDWNGDGLIDECFAPFSCTVNPNSLGSIATIHLQGTPLLGANNFRLIARDLTFFSTGYFLMSSGSGFVPGFGGGAGNLCLAAPLHRFIKPPTGRVLNSGSNRQFRLIVDLTKLPDGVVFQPGETWYFQALYRDGSTFNASQAVAVMWR